MATKFSHYRLWQTVKMQNIAFTEAKGTDLLVTETKIKLSGRKNMGDYSKPATEYDGN